MSTKHALCIYLVKQSTEYISPNCREIDRSEDERDRLEKEATSQRTHAQEASEVARRLQEENEQLKQLLKRETERLDAELEARANVIREYKVGFGRDRT